MIAPSVHLESMAFSALRTSAEGAFTTFTVRVISVVSPLEFVALYFTVYVPTVFASNPPSSEIVAFRSES